MVLYQPYRPPMRGKDEAYREFNRLEWLPGLHGVVERSLGFDRTMFIEWQMKLPVDGKMASIRAIDRLRVEGGLATEREVYFDQMALVRAVLRRPAGWLGYVGSRFGSRLR